jgi:hypothetical protein
MTNDADPCWEWTKEQIIEHLQIEEKQDEIRYTLIRGSRDRWRSVAMALADELYKRSPHLPDLEAFYQLLNDPYDGDGVYVG